MDANNELSFLLQSLEDVRSKRKALSSATRVRQQRQAEKVVNSGVAEEWKMRAVIAENRNAELEAALEKEKKARNRLAHQLAGLEQQIIEERELFDSEARGWLETEDSMKEQIRREHYKARKANEALKTEIQELNSMISDREAEIQAWHIRNDQLQREIDLAMGERKDALMDAKLTRTKLELLESKVIPKANEERLRLESEIQRLRKDLEESIEAEATLRSLVLQDQGARMRRRQHNENRHSFFGTKSIALHFG